MARATSQQLIQRAHARGLTNEQIARLVGRDSSLVSQIARGKKPGANLRDALARAARVKPQNVSAYLKRNGTIEAARRTTAEGTPARVRGGARATTPGNQSVRGGSRIGVTLRKRLERAARQGKEVTLLVRAREIRNYSGGKPDQKRDAGLQEGFYGTHDPQAVLDALDAAGWASDPEGALMEALHTLSPSHEALAGFRGYTLSTSDPR